MENLSAVLVKRNEIVLEDRPVPEVESDEVLIRMTSVGICGSDVHYWKRGCIGSFVVKAPMVLGHEGSGVVVKCGMKVSHLYPGDRVAIEPGVPCRVCDFCKMGRYNLCPEVKFCATPPFDGNLCRYYKHPADFCYKLPHHVSMEEGALIEPLSVAVHACRRAKVSLGKTVLVCGAGPIGLLNIMTAKAMGALEVIVTDIQPAKLKLAKSSGADDVYLIEPNKDAELLSREVTQLFKGGRQPDISLECSGSEASIAMSIFATRSGGTVLLIGLGAPTANIPIVNATIREVDVKGLLRYANCYPTAIEMVSSGRVNVKPLITHRFDLEHVITAFETANDNNSGAVKVMIHCDKQA